MTTPPDHTNDDLLALQRSALETSQAVLMRQRRMELQLQHAKAELESLTAQQTQALSLLNATLDASPDGVVALDLAGRVVTLNARFLRMWNIPPHMAAQHDSEAIRAHCSAAVVDPAIFAEVLPPLLGAEHPPLVEEVRLRDGRVLERHVSPQLLDGQPCGVVVHWHDLTKRRDAELQRNRMALMLERSLNEVYSFDWISLRFEYANAGALRNLGYDLNRLRTMTPLDIKPEYDEPGFRRLLQPLVDQQTEQLVFETVHERADGSRYDVQVYLQCDTQDGRSLLMALVLDITERKQAQHLIWQQANFDVLTRLPNRSMLQDRLQQEITKTQRNHGHLALLFLDLDKFKEVNDTLGHAQGDCLLVVASQRIRACVRASDTVARMGGDEFVVLLSELQDPRAASDVAQSLLQTLAEPFNLGGTSASVSCSIGITVFPGDATDAAGLLKHADQAMYVSKSRGRNQFSYFTQALELASQRRLHLTGQLRHALSHGQLELYFQPIVDMATLRVSKAEALLRWRHPELGMVSPAEFIVLAEESGLIVPIGDWVLAEALRWVKAWRGAGRSDFQISVNKSPVQFLREHQKAATWAQQLRDMDAPSSGLVMEITEGLLLDPQSGVGEILLAYRDAGIQVAIDDFGTGYSSLAYLKNFDIDYLKIDQSFIRNLAPGSSDLALCEAIIVMAHALGLKVVAEGVESPLQFELLRQARCDFAQGYLFSAAVPPEQFTVLLETGFSM